MQSVRQHSRVVVSDKNQTLNFGDDSVKLRRDLLLLDIWPEKMSPILEYLRLDRLVVHVGTIECNFRECIIPDCAILAFNQGFTKGLTKRLGLEDGHDRYTRARTCWREATVQDWRKRAK